MKKKRPSRKSHKPPPARSAGKPAHEGPLQYKVVELSSVDELSLEGVINDWVRRGWALDGIQFAMRESSKRPAMAFVVFTRRGAEAEPDEAAARERLRRLSEDPDQAEADSSFASEQTDAQRCEADP